LSSLTRKANDHHRTAAIVQPLADWRTRAACAGQDKVMDCHQADEDAVRAAKAVCWACPVIDDCRADVLRLPERLDPDGVCAAMTGSQRSAARRERGLPSTTARKCSGCGATKTRADFDNDTFAASGLRSDCKTCRAKTTRARLNRTKQRGA
jgi:hypothetical protein